MEPFARSRAPQTRCFCGCCATSSASGVPASTAALDLCGCCTVHMDGRTIRSCCIAVGDVGHQSLTTIEHLNANGLHPLQEAWIKLEVSQCGYCQSGQIMQCARQLHDRTFWPTARTRQRQGHWTCARELGAAPGRVSRRQTRLRTVGFERSQQMNRREIVYANR